MKADFRTFRSAAVVLVGAALFTVAGAWAADAAAGKALFATKCKTCHGVDGTPPPAMAKAMGIKPINDPATQAKSDGALKDVILKGGGKMKAVAVSPEEADNLVAAVRAMK